MANAKFTRLSTVVTFSRDPGYPATGIGYRQPSVRAAGGHEVVGDLAYAEKILTLSWPYMPLDELEALRSFFTDTVNGMALTFSYTDVRGVITTVRFADPEIVVGEAAYGMASVTVRLEVA